MSATRVQLPDDVVESLSSATTSFMLPTSVMWSAGRRIAFRFAFAYFVLYLFPFPLGNLPLVGGLVAWAGPLQNAMARWTEVHIFGLAQPVPIVPTGSGDTMAQYALQLDWVLLAVLITIVWSALDRRRLAYTRLNQWLHVYVRFGLATIMFGYGFAKIIPTQMGAPTLERLVAPWGEFSPMGVLWSFMGASATYEIFTGIGEALGSLLLVFRRTVTLGALLLVAVLMNVVLLNYTFDVPVKLYSSNLLLMAFFLLTPDLWRLLCVLVLNRPAPARDLSPMFEARWKNRLGLAMRSVFIAYVMYLDIERGLRYYRESIGPNAPKSALYGIWDVEQLSKNGVDQPPLMSDSLRLRRIVFGGLSRATLRTMSDSVERYVARVSDSTRTVRLTGRFDSTQVHTWVWQQPDGEHLVLAGKYRGDSVAIRLRRVDERKFLLLNRGYHWIQEQPFNR